MMNRRRFLTALAVGTAAVVVDPEQLLWTPGKVKTFDLGAMPKFISDPVTGISVRFVEKWDIAADLVPCRHDVMVLRPDFNFNLNFPDHIIQDAAKALADKIDAEALRAYRGDILYGLGRIKA